MGPRLLGIAGLVLLGAASALWAGPFSEVPAGHWAYESCARLVSLGVLAPERAGGFSGDPQLTRFEFGIALLEPLGAVDRAVEALGPGADPTARAGATARALGLSWRLPEGEIISAAAALERLAGEFSDVLAEVSFDPSRARLGLRAMCSPAVVREWRGEAISQSRAWPRVPSLRPAGGEEGLRIPLARGTLALTVGEGNRAPEMLDAMARAAAEAPQQGGGLRLGAGEELEPAEPGLRDLRVSRLRTAYEYGLGSALTLSLAYEEIARQGSALGGPLLDAASLASLGIGYRLTPSTSVNLSYSLLEYSNHALDTAPVRDRVAETRVSIEF